MTFEVEAASQRKLLLDDSNFMFNLVRGHFYVSPLQDKPEKNNIDCKAVKVDILLKLATLYDKDMLYDGQIEFYWKHANMNMYEEDLFRVLEELNAIEFWGEHDRKYKRPNSLK